MLKTKQKNFEQLQYEIEQARSALNSLINEQQRSSGFVFINYIFNNGDYFTPLADQLVESLNDRDEPMSFNDIKEVFDFSGFKYTEEHILACNPDSQETIDEQIRHYRE